MYMYRYMCMYMYDYMKLSNENVQIIKTLSWTIRA